MSDIDNNLQYQMQQQAEIRQSSVRQTPLTSFGETFQRGLSMTANTTTNALNAAGYSIPGGTVVSAAISGVGTVRSSSSGLSVVSTSATGLTATTGGTTATAATTATSNSAAMTSVSTNAANGDSSSQLLLATQQMQEMNRNFNLQYLQLQENMQAESREYTAMSNVIKTKSDTVVMRHYSEEQRLRFVSEWRDSGLSRVDFARKSGVSAGSLTRWAKSKTETLTTTAFRPLLVVESPPPPQSSASRFCVEYPLSKLSWLAANMTRLNASVTEGRYAEGQAFHLPSNKEWGRQVTVPYTSEGRFLSARVATRSFTFLPDLATWR